MEATARLHGRLGNQMFQYAAARSLAERLCVPVALDRREALARGEGVLTRVFDLKLVEPAPLPPPRREAPLRYLLLALALSVLTSTSMTLSEASLRLS